MNASRGRRIAATLVAAWALVTSRNGSDWQVVGQFPNPSYCQQARAVVVDQETQGQIGGALASQPADNPLRQEAYRRAERHVQERYRCAEVR